MTQRDHLFVSGRSTSLKYSPIRPQIDGDGFQRRGRQSHGQALLASLNSVYESARQNIENQELIPEGDRGFYAVFEGAAEADLPVKFFAAKTRGMDLLRLENDGEERRQDATVFVRSAKVAKFGSDIGPYIEAPQNSVDRPTNADFFDRLESIRSAKLEDLWNESSALPKKGENFDWEVWVRPGTEDFLRDTAPELDVDIQSGVIHFPEASVVRARCTREQLASLIRRVPVIAELRAASGFSAGLVDMTSRQQADAADALLRRIVPPPTTSPRVCVIDSGVRRGHPLLAPFIEAERCLTVNSAWGSSDHHGHGTAMAGVALYGDLSALLSTTTPVVLSHRLESVTALPPAVSGAEAPLAGDSIRQAIRLAERTARARRVFSMSMSAPKERTDGVPSSLSTVLDQLAFGRGRKRRLIVVPAGNIDDVAIKATDHIDLNDATPMRSPAQAMNAVTVGACTHLVETGLWPKHLAPLGDLSPTSRTALTWTSTGVPNKPDIVMEGGNLAVDVDGISTVPTAELRVLTTARDFAIQRFACTGDTSAATAAAANMAGAILAKYPAATPETVRALMLHSARWTPAMRGRISEEPNRGEVAQLMRRFGYGMPSRERALASLDNELTMIVQSEITPYKTGDGRKYTLNEMIWHDLPWPRQALSLLGDAEVKLRVTLAYFAEPNPTSVTRGQGNRYPSFRLAWFLKGADEEADEAIARVNTASRGEDWSKTESREENRFVIGTKNNRRGTVHQDIWIGPASDLLEKDGIGILPTKGWWGDKAVKAKRSRAFPYSLVVSIETPETSVAQSVYTEISTTIQAPVETEIGISSW